MKACAVPHETSTSPSPVAPAPTAALRWSCPPTASTAPRARGSASPAVPAGVVAGCRVGEQAGRGARPRERLVPPVAGVDVEPARARRERELGDLLAAEPVHDPLRRRSASACRAPRPRARRAASGTSPASTAAAARARCARRSAPAPSSAAIRSACAAPRESCQAIAGATGSPCASSSTPVSAKLATPSAPIGPSGAAASASRAAASAASTSRSGAISAPVGTRSHGTRARPCATSRPPWVTTAALQEVVPRSSPSSSGSTPRLSSSWTCRASPGCRRGSPS